ncbi:hypothetical protein [Flagellimonas lutaonensis]|nr:hypothetical protein [Allomuricauda lutaonensis]
MQFLNKQIEALAKSPKKSLVKKQVSCGIFQEIELLKKHDAENTHKQRHI